MREVLRVNPRQRRQVNGLLFGGPKPDEVGVFDQGVEHHQPLNRVVQSDGFAEAAFGLPDGCVESPPVHVVDPGAVVPAVVH